jgi:hypothetical protein
MSLFLQNLS